MFWNVWYANSIKMNLNKCVRSLIHFTQTPKGIYEDMSAASARYQMSEIES